MVQVLAASVSTAKQQHPVGLPPPANLTRSAEGPLSTSPVLVSTVKSGHKAVMILFIIDKRVPGVSEAAGSVAGAETGGADGWLDLTTSFLCICAPFALC